MSPDLDQLAAQAVRTTPTRVPAMSEVRTAARRRSHRRRGGIAGAVLVVAAVGGGLWAVVPDDGERTVAVIAGGTSAPDTTTTAPVAPAGDLISGVLPSGERYTVRSDTLDRTVTGISAGIMLDDGAAQARAVGIVTFRPSDAGVPSSADDEAGTVVEVAGDWALHLSLYDDVRRQLGPRAATEVTGWIEATAPAHESGLPAFELSAPLRWATDEELPLAMQTQYPQFVVRRGCDPAAQACSDDERVQVLAAEDVVSPAPAWPGGAVTITSG